MTIAEIHDSVAEIIGPCSNCGTDRPPAMDDPSEFIRLYRDLERAGGPVFRVLQQFRGHMVCDRCAQVIGAARDARDKQAAAIARGMTERAEAAAIARGEKPKRTGRGRKAK